MQRKVWRTLRRALRLPRLLARRMTKVGSVEVSCNCRAHIQAASTFSYFLYGRDGRAGKNGREHKSLPPLLSGEAADFELHKYKR
jgi:hypothetical protein